MQITLKSMVQALMQIIQMVPMRRWPLLEQIHWSKHGMSTAFHRMSWLLRLTAVTQKPRRNSIAICKIVSPLQQRILMFSSGGRLTAWSTRLLLRMARDALAMPTCSKLSSDQLAQVRSILRGYSKKPYLQRTLPFSSSSEGGDMIQ